MSDLAETVCVFTGINLMTLQLLIIRVSQVAMLQNCKPVGRIHRLPFPCHLCIHYPQLYQTVAYNNHSNEAKYPRPLADHCQMNENC